jgi:hypothetical protein
MDALVIKRMLVDTRAALAELRAMRVGWWFDRGESAELLQWMEGHVAVLKRYENRLVLMLELQ